RRYEEGRSYRFLTERFAVIGHGSAGPEIKAPNPSSDRGARGLASIRRTSPRSSNNVLLRRDPPSARPSAEGAPYRAALLIAARRRDSFARQPSGVVGGKEYRNLRDVFRLAKSAKRGL